MINLEEHFEKFRKNVIGSGSKFKSPQGKQQILYADWIASGRLYQPIEDFIQKELGPFVANTHTETTVTGTRMTDAYHQAHHIIKDHVNASKEDVLIPAGFGMTAVVNKFQRILGLRIDERFKQFEKARDKALVIITHMEHHSNQTTWLECNCDVEIVPADQNGLPDLKQLESILEKNAERSVKIGSFSACSNVTGIITPYHEMAKIMHRHNGLCFVDFAASAPYVEINMHPDDPQKALDAIFFSPHKFLGGPGSSGIMIFNQSLYHCETPDHPGGGTVKWTNPWGKHSYFEDIETREDGGTPGFLQLIRASLAILLKEEMNCDKIMTIEHELIELFRKELRSIKGLNVLEDNDLERIAVFSVYSIDKHYNLIVKLLNDRYGIQTRGGCSCAGTYGHILLHVDEAHSNEITRKIEIGDLTDKPGWVRISLHPTMTTNDVLYIANALRDIVENYDSYKNDYLFDKSRGEFEHKHFRPEKIKLKDTFRNIL